ncbi:MAG: malectin domain-containing carbohydrate-binding protein [Candidatus Sulfotelmatobacter sp.]
MRRSSSKLRQFFMAVLFLAPLIFAFTSWPPVAYAQDVPSCTGVANITIGSTTYAPQWCDEFTGAAGPPSTTVWKYDLGNNGGWGNGEAEVYCGPPGYAGNPSQCPTTFSTATAPVYIDGNGHLVIQVINENGAWLSGRMNTEGLENFTYGILEASILLPNTTNQGLWPAFWTLGSDITTVPWPSCGEADIMENWSPQVDNGKGTTGDDSTIHTTKTGGDGVGSPFTFPSGEATDTAFHTYGIVWSENEMQFFVDNPSSPFFTATPSILPAGDTWPFNQSIFTILNVAVGGTLGGSDAGLTSPQLMQVGYVRWYTPVTAACTTVPSAPTGLTATASSSSAIGLTWTAVTPPTNCTISGYNVYGSTTSGFTPGSGNLIASGVTGTSYTNTGLAASTTYYYVVEAVDAEGSSAASTQASAETEAAGAVTEVIAIAAGGPAQSNASGGDYSFVADEDYVGGADNGTVTATINLTQPGANAAPMGVYQNGRFQATTYTIPGLTPDSTYTVLLHFAETYFGAAGDREFNVAINGTTVLTNFDIFGTVGAKDAALVEIFTATANSSGQIVIALTNGAVNLPLIMGIEIRTTSSCATVPSAPTGLVATASSSSVIGLSWTAVTPPANCTISSYSVYRSTTSGFTPSGSTLVASGLTSPSYSNTGLVASTTYYFIVEALDSYGTSTASAQATATTQAGTSTEVVAINSEGPAVSNSGGGDYSFVADEYFTGGGAATPTTATISTTAAGANAAPMAVYQTQRDGVFTYTIPGLTAGATYTVLIHCAEIYFTAAGDREYNVDINGTAVLTNFDQFAAAGGKDIAVVKSFNTTANSSGEIVVSFTDGAVNQPSVAGLEIRTN